MIKQSLVAPIAFVEPFCGVREGEGEGEDTHGQPYTGRGCNGKKKYIVPGGVYKCSPPPHPSSVMHRIFTQSTF